MRGTWVLVVVVGRMVLKVWGLGADGRIALGMFWKSEERGNNIGHPHVSFFDVKRGSWLPINVEINHQSSTYAEDALLEWPNGGWGGAGPVGWQSSMQHDFGPEKNKDKDLIITWYLTALFSSYSIPYMQQERIDQRC